MSNSDDDDWFNKDDEELLKDVQTKVEQVKSNTNEATEHITGAISNDEVLMHQWRLNAAAALTVPQQNMPKLRTSEMRKLTDAGNALDIFLLALTNENPNFFDRQISENDAIERVILYTRLYAMMVELKVPGFQLKIIQHFAQDEPLLAQFVIITTKIFNKRFSGSILKTEKDTKSFQQFISDLQLLLLQAAAFNVLTPKVTSTIEHIKRLLQTADAKESLNWQVVKELTQNLLELSIHDLDADQEDHKVQADVAFKNEIYPTLSELLNDADDNKEEVNTDGEGDDVIRPILKLEPESSTLTDDADESPKSLKCSLATHNYKNVQEYLAIQKNALRQDFMLSLADCVRELKRDHQLSANMAAQVMLYEDVEIVLNKNFLNALRHEMLFVHFSAAQKKSMVKKQLGSLMTGSLICLTTSYDFDNLILALVTHQDHEYNKNGYLAIEIVRQFNIGNVYNKKLIIFSSPAFFEPYHNVYNYLSTCSIEDFPMKDVVVFGGSEIQPPNYLTKKTVYKREEFKFKPLLEMPPEALPLNNSQREALKKVLTEKFALVQGPPGTGKTYLSVELVAMLLENQTPPKPLVVVAFTNESLDKFLLNISQHTTSIARLGSQTRLPEISKFNVHGVVSSDYQVHPRLKRLYYVVKTEFESAFKELQVVQHDFDGTDENYKQVIAAQNKVRKHAEQLNTLRVLFQFYMVRERQVLAMTTTCAAKMNFLFRLLGCKIVIFEEAAEILESHVMACLTPQTEHVIMIGDHMQLKPYTSNYQLSRHCDLNISLFERLIDRHILQAAVLLTQYRMRPIIAELMCPIFYDELYNDKSVERYRAVVGMRENLFFVTHNEPERKYDYTASLCNDYEVEKIVKLATFLMQDAGHKAHDIVILSPYTGQCEELKLRLPHKSKLLRIMTVDSFQGLEAKTVLLSLVRSNAERQIGFLKERNRICVALSRAKHGLYIIGNLGMLASRSKTWREIKTKLTTHQLIGDDFPYDEKQQQTKSKKNTSKDSLKSKNK